MYDGIKQGRMRKVNLLRKVGIKPYDAYRFSRTHTMGELTQRFARLRPSDQMEESKVSCAGRIRSLRIHGKAGFADVEDLSGRIQIYVKYDVVGRKKYKVFSRFLDVGDIIGVKGVTFKTRMGELSILTEDFWLLSKCLRDLPSNWYGLKNTEIRYRKRYLDLLMNQESKIRFIRRSKIISCMREFLDRNGFLEVETPMMSHVVGGALAKPFVTHHNELDIDLYLRIATELYLKRLIVGGFEKVYEIGKDFRNESIDTLHNPDFTMMELYQAYADYNDVAQLTEQMICYIAKRVLEIAQITYKGIEVDLSPPWHRMTMIESIKRHCGITVDNLDHEQLMKVAEDELGILDKNMTRGELTEEIFQKKVQPNLVQPTFIFDFPIEVSPLAKRKRDNLSLAERFELFIAGIEIGNAFSELNDPFDQRERFMQQLRRREAGDEKAHVLDEDYIKALEYGLPPTGGLGVGIDRLVMVLTDAPSIRDVILFPVMRPETMLECKPAQIM